MNGGNKNVLTALKSPSTHQWCYAFLNLMHAIWVGCLNLKVIQVSQLTGHFILWQMILWQASIWFQWYSFLKKAKEKIIWIVESIWVKWSKPCWYDDAKRATSNKKIYFCGKTDFLNLGRFFSQRLSQHFE